MALTFDQIYNRYGVREFIRYIEVKRRNENGTTYEGSFNNIETLANIKLFENSIKSISRKLPNDSYNFGFVAVGDLDLFLDSKFGQFGEESLTGSIFNGYLRHKSIIRIREGYIDPTTNIEVINTVFEGFIDESSTSTKVDATNTKQTLKVIERLNFILRELLWEDVKSSFSGSYNLESFIYTLLNRSEFTNFMTVSASNINAGYNIGNINYSGANGIEDDTTLLDILKELSKGHSFFYLKNDIFYYKDINSGDTTNFVINKNKIIKFESYNNGADKVIEKLYWEDQEDSINYTASTVIYNKSKKIKINYVNNDTDKQLLLNKIGSYTSIKRQLFKLEIPYYNDIELLDIINIELPVSSIDDEGFTWDISNWDTDYWSEDIRADNVSSSANYIVRELQHSNYKSKFILQQLI